ncbi:MAG TPA: hypothetical protein ENK66_00945 [Arcobacter sp.]|nr:hypothetical protein [Arcobacter sp.]
MKNLIKFLTFLSMSMFFVHADKNESIGAYCFESPYIFIDGDTKVKKLVLHFEDFNRSSEDNPPIRMFYKLENDNRRYSVPNVFMSYIKENNIYRGGVECDGGSVEFNATNNRLSMEEIRMSGACGEIAPPFGFEVEKIELDDSLEDIVEISNAQEGWMGIGFLGKDKEIDYRKKKLWIKGKKCINISL